MVAKFVYAQAHKDILYAFINNVFTEEQMKESLQGLLKAYKEEYGENAKSYIEFSSPYRLGGLPYGVGGNSK